jgi:hypothetical protein
MGKRKRMLQQAAPLLFRSHDLYAECRKYGVSDIYDLPVTVHFAFRSERLRGAA